ncbi:MAG: phosphoribosylformylglycinamidine synthase subunit PurQ, partial [Clostridia bacterium]|nr:phosphoribosylformylglycinamidine synthase subunit PurQ [Clostridia bacterium]
LMAYGFDPELSAISPYHGALYAVVDSVTKIAAMGGDVSKVRLTFQEYFERLGMDPEKWAKPFTALLGALKAQTELKIPAIGGKDSMSGSFMDLNVPPTLVSFAVDVADAGKILSTELKKENSTLVYVTADRDENQIIDFKQYQQNMSRIHELALTGKILSANTIGRGGFFISLVKMAVGNRIGADLNGITGKELRSADYGALLLEIDSEENIEALMKGIQYRVVGTTTDTQELVIQLAQSGAVSESMIKMSLEDITKKWTEPLESVFPTKRKSIKEEMQSPKPIYYTTRSTGAPAIKIAKPKVFIPAFPGTNCEMDSKRAFEKAGAAADIQILRNLKEAQLIQSIDEMVEKIKNSQIIMIPGGFSGGDEPDGSAKFITAVFRNPAVKEAVADLLENRDGMMLGICNGFQALIKLGLVPFGKITEPDDANPTLTYNRIGRHASCLVNTRIASVKSPWLANTEVGDIHTIPVSHGEGRFIASDAVLEELLGNGQIATQYVDLSGNPSMDAAYNPNESVLAIEGITSPDGRVFGKMGHSERIGKNLYKNVIGNTDQRIFEAGVAYFK